MLCGNCSHENRSGSNFCSNCGSPLVATLTSNAYYGIFYHGGYGDGYNTSFGFENTIEGALAWQNSSASLSLNDPSKTLYIVELHAMDLLPSDAGSYVTQRLRTPRWWKLIWDGGKWAVGQELLTHPDSIGISALERG